MTPLQGVRRRPPESDREGPRPGAAPGPDGGFSLVELLVVILVLAVLAAVAVPTFLRQRERGWDAASKSELKNAAAALESLHVDAGSYASGAVPGNRAADLAPLSAQGFNLSPAYQEGSGGSFEVVISGPAGSAYCVQVTHRSQPSAVWVLRSAHGLPQKVGSGSPAVAPCA